MNAKELNTNIEFQFCDGTKTELTLSFYRIYQLRQKNKNLYERYSRIMQKKQTDELETITILYTAYVCAHLDSEEIMNEEEFMILCGSDRMEANNAAYALMRPKKH